MWVLIPSTQIRLYVQKSHLAPFENKVLFFIRFEFTQIIQILVQYFILFSRAKPIQDDKGIYLGK